MKLLLHDENSKNFLREHYAAAIADAVELYIVSAYLTHWDSSIPAPANVKRLRVVVGIDFGITRKVACRELLNWMPADKLNDFRAAEGITGFHPKAIFWKTASGDCRSIVGSSNLTRAAFDGNVEANVYGTLSAREFAAARSWIEDMCEPNLSVPISEEWIEQYQEGQVRPKRTAESQPQALSAANSSQTPTPVIQFQLPDISPERAAELMRRRRGQLAIFEKGRGQFQALFRAAAAGNVSSADFYAQINQLWSLKAGNRLQGAGWERRGAKADFCELARAFVSILDATSAERDSVVRTQLNNLRKTANPARKAWFSEMLSLHWPARYPVLNKPVRQFLAENRFRPPRRAPEGVRYIDLAQKLAAALSRAPAGYPAKTIAELDYLIWAVAPGNEDSSKQ
ncbi:phospholipase D family protein [Stenotrophomonas sp. Sa5BUN4]|uniref:Phospholipase D family protein n=1 Tax=Stenotrophomonas lacuserhaii TaxID=2760084 RepID=A0A8X8K0L3_9GAMM|nr:phospholipase D family protein [Stenotrophomonas pennii]MBD7954713.1 phospholipase D family protein [Stenotrophomonas pennii]